MKKFFIKILTIILIMILLFMIQISPISYATDEEVDQSTVDDMITGAQNFIDTGESGALGVVNEEVLGGASNFLYNLLLGIGLIVVVAVGIALGIKFMYSSLEERAQIKEMLIAYVAGCVVIFGAFGIWRLVANILLSTS